MDKTCFFIGHRYAPDHLGPELAEVVERHITEYGVREFTVGRYGRFDSLAAWTVKEAKKRHPDVRLVYLRPYHPAERPIEAPEGFDSSFYPFEAAKVPRPVAIVRANCYMVDNSDFLIAYARHPGNAIELVEYARRREKRGLIHVSVVGGPLTT